MSQQGFGIYSSFTRSSARWFDHALPESQEKVAVQDLRHLGASVLAVDQRSTLSAIGMRTSSQKDGSQY